jgi:hypothetical protein
MIRFSLFGWRVVARVHRPRRITREQLERAGVIVCGPDVERRAWEDAEREMHEYQVMSDLYRVVNENVAARIEDTCNLAVLPECVLPITRVREFLRDLRDIAWRMDQPPSALAAAAGGGEEGA